MSECLKRDKRITRWMISLHVAMTMLILPLLFTAITGAPILGFIAGIIIWTLVLFKTPVFDWTFINVQPNWAIILGNQIIHDKLDDDPNKRIKMFDLASMREVGPGLRGRYPTEVVYESVDLQSELVIGNSGQNKLLQCYTKDNIPLEIEWQDILTPLRGFLVNLVRKGEEASQAFFRGQFEQFIIKWVKDNNESDVFSKLNNLKQEFKDMLGGEDAVDPKEEEYGWFTNTPQILFVKRSQRYQNAAEGVMIGNKMKQVIGEINAQFLADHGFHPDPNMVLATAASIVGNEINGILLIPGLSDKGDNATALMAAAANASEILKKKGTK